MKRVLIADDEPITLRLLEASVRRTGCDCALFGSGSDVMREMEAVAPDLAILDYEMPGCNGIDLIRAFRGSPILAGKPIIVVTGYRELALQEALLEAGANEVILKPFSPGLLGQRVVELLA